MSLMELTIGAPSAGRLGAARLAPTPSPLARLRSRVAHEMAAFALPRSVLLVRGARDNAHKRVALTFDDGPDDMTIRYLDVLERLGVRATFFLIGENVARAPGMVREYLRRGHEVGGHGWTHESFASMDLRRLDDELARTGAVLSAAGATPRFMRPPRGALSARVLFRTAAAGYVTTMWSVDSDDCRTRDPRLVARRVTPDRVDPGDIVLFHELQPWTVEALPRIVDGLHRAAWETVTVSELAITPRAGRVRA
jgi:peptidoglycan-N-acetylglucosamine deacetylase